MPLLEPEPCHLINLKTMINFDSEMVTKSQHPLEHFVVSASKIAAETEIEPALMEAPIWKRCLGLIFGLFAALFFSLSIGVAKHLSQYHAFNLGIYRSQGILIPSVFALIYSVGVKKTPVLDQIWPWTDSKKRTTTCLVIARSITGSSAIVSQYYSLQYISVGDSSVIAMSTPIFVTILAFLLLGEDIGAVSIFAALATLVGVVIVSRPPFLTGNEAFDNDTLIGIGFALGAMLLTTLTFLVLRKIKDVHYSVVSIFFGAIGSLQCLILALATGVAQLPSGLFDWGLAIALALTSYLGQTCLMLAFKYEAAGPVSLIRTTDVIFAFLWQLLFFGVNPDIFSIVGAVIIIMTVLVIGIHKYGNWNWFGSVTDKNLLRARARLWGLVK